MKRIIFVWLGLFILAFSAFSSVRQVLDEWLNKDLSYQKLLTEQVSAERAMAEYEGFFLPYLSIGTGSSGFVFDESGLKTGEIALNADFLNILGARVGISLPYGYTRAGDQTGWGFDSFVLTASRELFPQEETKKLELQAASLKAAFSLNQRRWTVFTDLVQSLFDYRHTTKLYAAMLEKVEIYRRFWAQENERVTKESYWKQVLTLEKMVQETQSLLIDYKQWQVYSSSEIEAFYEEIMTLIPSHAAQCDTGAFRARRDLLALEAEVKSAKKTGDFWYLPYLPNPQFSLSARFDIESPSLSLIQRISWSLSVKMDIPLLDRGERELEALKRKRNRDLKVLEYAQAVASLEDQMEKLSLKQRATLIEIELKGLEVGQSLERLQRDERLQKLGYLTEKEYRISYLDHQETELEYEKVQQKQIIGQLELLKACDATFGGL